MSADMNETELEMLLAELAKSFEEASPGELLAEAKAAGRDTERIADHVKGTLLDAVRSFEQRKLHAARLTCRTRSSEAKRRRIVLPATTGERRGLLFRASQNNPQVQQITARFRELKEISDDDVESALEDLMELGAFDEVASLGDDENQ